MMSKLNPRIIWVSLFSLVNLVCGVAVFSGQKLLGDAATLGLDDRSVVPWATLLVIASYVLPLLCLFPLLNRIHVKQIRFSRHYLGNFVGVLLLILQIAHIFFFVSTGTGVAGSTNRSEGSLSVFFVLVNVDLLLILYYGFYRDSRVVFLNLLVGVASNLLRGWNGILIIIIFMESCRLMRAGKLRLWHLATAAFFGAVGFPIVYLLKWQVRGSLSNGIGDAGITQLMAGVVANLTKTDLIDVVKAAFLGLFARLQIVSNVIGVMQNTHKLSQDVSIGVINPFWREGFVGLVLDRLSGTRTSDLGVGLAQIIDPLSLINWNSNPGYVAWFFVSPWYIAQYILYTTVLCFLSVYLVRKVTGTTTALDMVWFVWFLYLIPGWIATFSMFLFCIIVFYVLHLIAASTLKWTSLLSRSMHTDRSVSLYSR